MSRAQEESNRRMLRARDTMDRSYAQPLDIADLARIAHVSPAHEMPHRYLQRRRVERAMFLLRETDQSITEICLAVGFASLGSFSRTFREIVGEPPTAFRAGGVNAAVPSCFAKHGPGRAVLEKRPHGIDCGGRDPFGNHFRIVQMTPPG